MIPDDTPAGQGAETATRRYDSFVFRYWQFGSERRIEIEHLQSGQRMRVATLVAAADWIGAQCGNSDLHASGPVAMSEEVMPGETQCGNDEREAKERAAPDWRRRRN